jgi:uncharacterized protein (DUF433 family)
MQLEDYFEFLAPDDIRIKGTRIGIEHILDEYVHQSKSPEAIAEQFQTASLEQIYATILYYLHNPTTVGHYVSDWLAYTSKAEEEFDRNPPASVIRVQQLRKQQVAL